MAQDVITRLKLESDGFNANVKKATAELNRMTTVAEQEGKSIATADAKNIKFAQDLGKMQTASTSASGKIRELSGGLEAATIAYNRLSAADKKGDFGKALKSSVDQLQVRLKNMRQEMAATQAQMAKGTGGGGLGGGMLKGLTGSLGGLGGMGGGLGSLAAGLGPMALAAGAATAAISGLKKAFGDYLSINREFEQANANLAAVLGTTRSEIELLTEDAKRYGATTMFTASQVTELQTNLAKLGFTQSEIRNSTKAVLDLSAATGYDLGESAAVAGAALRSFGLNATEMSRVTSVLGVSTTKSALDMEKLSVAMPIVGSAANAMGFSIEDTVALLGKLVDTGMDASTAATALRNIFLKLADPSSKMSKAIGGNIRSLDDLVPALQKCKDEGMDLGEMFEIAKERGTVAFNTLVNGAEDVAKLRNELNDCSDAMKKMVGEQMNTLEGASKELDSAWEGLMLSFKSSNGILAETKRALADLLNAWTRWNNRAHGGEAALGDIYSGLSDQDNQGVKDKIDAQLKKGGGNTRTALRATYQQNLDFWTEEEKSRTALLKKWEEAGKLGWGSKEVQSLMPQVEKTFGKMNGSAYEWAGQMRNSVAESRKRRDINQQAVDYLAPTVAQTKVDSGSGTSGDDKEAEKERKKREREAKSRERAARQAQNQAEKDAREQLRIQKAQLEEQEKQQIASLDAMSMTQEEYDKKVYDIKHDTLEKIAALYKDQTQEKADANARIYDLEIQHNQKMAAAARKASDAYAKEVARREKEAEEARKKAGIGDYSTEGISARKKTAENALSSADIGSTAYMIEADKIVDLDSLSNLLNVAIENGLNIDQEHLKGLLDMIDLGVDIPDQAWEILAEEINKQLEQLGLPPIKLDVKTGNVKELDSAIKKTTDNVNGAIGVFGQLGDVMQQIEDPGAKVAGLIMSAIAEVAATFAKSLEGTFTPWDWIAASISGVATMISTISAIKSATSGSYASGGIIPGNSYSGDNLTANVNAGELILNRAQQDSIASQLTGNNPMQNLQLSTEISGTNLRIVMNNDNRSKGGSRGFYSNIH